MGWSLSTASEGRGADLFDFVAQAHNKLLAGAAAQWENKAMKKTRVLFVAASVLSTFPASGQEAPRPEPSWVSDAGIIDLAGFERSPILPGQLADREGIREALILWGIGIDEDNNELKQSVLTEDATLIAYIGSGDPVITMTSRSEVVSGMSTHFQHQRDQRRRHPEWPNPKAGQRTPARSAKHLFIESILA